MLAKTKVCIPIWTIAQLMHVLEDHEIHHYYVKTVHTNFQNIFNLKYFKSEQIGESRNLGSPPPKLQLVISKYCKYEPDINSVVICSHCVSIAWIVVCILKQRTVL